MKKLLSTIGCAVVLAFTATGCQSAGTPAVSASTATAGEIHAQGNIVCPPTVRNGTNSSGWWIDWVEILQNTLNQAGYNAGTADGIFGQNTERAVKRFQRDQRLSQDGIVGPDTWMKLHKCKWMEDHPGPH